jgi:hypothetical protein
MRSSGDSAWHHEQGLPASVQPSPPGSDLAAALTQHVGEHDQRAVDTVFPEGQDNTRSSWSDELI